MSTRMNSRLRSGIALRLACNRGTNVETWAYFTYCQGWVIVEIGLKVLFLEKPANPDAL